MLEFVKSAIPTTGQQFGLLPLSCVPPGQAVELRRLVAVVRPTSTTCDRLSNWSARKNASRAGSAATVGSMAAGGERSFEVYLAVRPLPMDIVRVKSPYAGALVVGGSYHQVDP